MSVVSKTIKYLLDKNISVSTAESCTGGLLASAFTDIAGASHWFNQSWVTYSNEAKISQLGVNPETLEKRGAVSSYVAIEMAKGALANADADIAISITGIAGPGNDSTTKKIGTVYVGIASKSWANAESTQIGGNRSENKIGFVHFALLTAIGRWDEAMDEAEENRKKLQQMAEEKERARKRAC